MMAATEQAAEIVAVVTDAGYRYVTLDLAGLRSGNLNHSVAVSAEASTP
jgi:PP-loop superfamily ATP-utilizing enzyme